MKWHQIAIASLVINVALVIVILAPSGNEKGAELRGKLEVQTKLIRNKDAELQKLYLRIDTLEARTARVDTVERITIRYYEKKREQILADSVDVDVREVRDFLRTIELPNR